jgi:hypothetical protein
MNVEPLKFAPMINRDKPIDMLMVYPLPYVRLSVQPDGALSILYPARCSRTQGMRVEYLDMRWDTQEMLDDLIKQSRQIGVSCFTGYQCGHAADILERAKELNPKIVTNVGGHHARMCPQDVQAEPFVDVVWPERAYHEHSFPFSEKAQRLVEARARCPVHHLVRLPLRLHVLRAAFGVGHRDRWSRSSARWAPSTTSLASAR